MDHDDAVVMRNIWAQYNLRSSPYFINPLDPIKTSQYPIDLFVGRGDELKMVLGRIASNENSRTVVEGVAGVGKTTFINNVKFIAGRKNDYLAFNDHIRMTGDYTPIQFVMDTIYLTLLALYHKSPKKREDLDADPAIARAKELIQGSTEDQVGGGLTIFGFGGSYRKTKARVLPLYNPKQFYSILEDLSTAVRARGLAGIMIHIDNVENLYLEDPALARGFFNDIRDILMVPGYHFIIGGRQGFTNDILGKDEKVRSIFPMPNFLGPLELKETHTLLNKRYKYLKVKGAADVIFPVESEVVDRYHALFRGDLRDMFQTLTDGIEQTGHQLEPRSLPFEAVDPLLRDRYTLRIREQFSDAEWRILEMLAHEGPLFRQSDLTGDRTGLTQGRISQIFTELEKGKAMILVKREGKSKYYSLSGISKIAFGLQTT